MIGLIILVLVLIYALNLYLQKQKRIHDFKMPPDMQQLLSDNVAFYTVLDESQRIVFERRIIDFLQHVTITGIGTTVEPID